VALPQALSALTVLLAVAYGTHRYAPAAVRKVYLLDTFTYKPPDRRAAGLRVPRGCRAACVRAQAACVCSGCAARGRGRRLWKCGRGSPPAL